MNNSLNINKENIPQYLPTNKSIRFKDCIDDSKTKKLIKDIEKANISQLEKKFLILAAQRHLVFNYKNIANYYANATKEVQKLMEDSALVIIDKDNAIANGFVKLCQKIDDIEGEK